MARRRWWRWSGWSSTLSAPSCWATTIAMITGMATMSTGTARVTPTIICAPPMCMC
ncbi:membrane protein [Sphingobium sp. C100]|nr:membrane protein [Sphingobium sp. C100]